MRKILLTTVFVLSLAAAAFAFLNSAQKGDASVPTQQVLAATIDLQAGTLLRAQDVTWKPASVTQSDEILHPADAAAEAKPEIVEETVATVYGAVLRRPLPAGTPIHRGDIVKPGEREFLQVVLAPGARAIAIPVATGGASTGLLTPGDCVDVLLTQNFKNDNTDETRNTPLTRRSVGETIVQNIRVLAITEPDTKANGAAAANPANGNFGRTVTLEVRPAQAQKLGVAAELGKLSVTLRNLSTVTAASPDTVGSESVPAATWAADVSPALLSTARPPKAVAVKPQPVMIFRGQATDDKLREQLVKPESDTKADTDK